MTRKSSKSPLIERFILGRAVAVTLLFCFTGGVRPTHAQQPTAANEKKSYVRFWNMLPDKPGNDLLVFAGDKPIFGVAPFDLYNDYVPSPVGSYSIVVKRSAEGEPILQKFPVTLPENTYVTLLATEKNGQPAIEIFNDSPDPKVTDLTAQLIVRSFFPGGRILVGTTGGQPPRPVANGETVTLDNIPMTAGVNVSIQVTMPTTPPSSKNVDLPADFSVTHRATLLLVPDRYGRLKPKLLYNGRLAHPDALPQGARR